MNSILGYGFTMLGLTTSLAGVAAGSYALITKQHRLLRQVRQWTWLALIAAVGAFTVMQVALFQRDYTVSFVQSVGSPFTPPLYNFAALWSALEGSIILWTLVLAGYLVAVAVKFRQRVTDPLFGWALVVMYAVTAFFFGLMAGPTNPFVRAVVSADFQPRGPNPLLQNHVLVAFHPPMLYLGYVGFTVPFAFAIAALITGRVGEGWLVETRRWTVIAWGFLTFGIVLGAWWSYEVLGWGGYWAWDPVENASLLPWLTGTAYIHSVMVQERRGMLRVWNLSLLCSTFCLTILGTFLTRSGVVESVHAFSEGEVGTWLLAFFAVVATLSVGLIGWRGDRLRSPGAIDSPVSREAAFLANNVIFGALAFVVLLGTVFPLLAEAYDGTRLTIGRPYFDSLGRPIAFVMLFLMASAPVLPWRKASNELLSERLFWPAVLGVAAMVLAVALGGRGLYPVFTFGLGGFAAGAAGRQVVLAARRQGWRGFVGRTNGGMIVHLGVVLIAVAVAGSESYKTDRITELLPGESVTVAGHTFEYVNFDGNENDRRIHLFANIRIDDDEIYTPGRTIYRELGQPVTTPSVKPGFSEDLFLVLDEFSDDPEGPIRLRVIVRPLISWMWAGGILMALGTLLAVFPGSRRRGTEAVSAAVGRDVGGNRKGKREEGPSTPIPAGVASTEVAPNV